MEHYYQGIAGWFDFEDIYRGAVATAESGAVLVEVGCWEGKSLAFLGVEAINSGKMLRVIGVDHFLGSAEHQERKSLDGLAERCRKNLEPCGAAVKIWQTDSFHASLYTPDESCHLVFLDGSHEYQDVMNDLNAWWKKIKPGGMMAGHDFFGWPGVGRAVNEWAITNDLLIVTSKSSWTVKKRRME